jgi:hypothetical protein
VQKWRQKRHAKWLVMFPWFPGVGGVGIFGYQQLRVPGTAITPANEWLSVGLYGARKNMPSRTLSFAG